MPLKEYQGTHCEVCTAPVQQNFLTWPCKRYHGNEFVCPTCKIWMDEQVPNLIDYLICSGGCIFEEVRFAEQRLDKQITPTIIYG